MVEPKRRRRKGKRKEEKIGDQIAKKKKKKKKSLHIDFSVATPAPGPFMRRNRTAYSIREKVNRKVQGVPQSQTAANPRHQQPVISTFVYGLDIIDQLHKWVYLWPSKGYRMVLEFTLVIPGSVTRGPLNLTIREEILFIRCIV